VLSVRNVCSNEYIQLDVQHSSQDIHKATWLCHRNRSHLHRLVPQWVCLSNTGLQVSPGALTWQYRYDTGCIGAITEMPFFTETFGELSPTLRGITVSLVMLGGVVPGFFAGQLADYYGRLATICTGAIIFLVGAIFQGAAYQLPMFMVGRLLCGIGEGTWMSSVQVYVAEIAPSARRGMLASMPAFE